MSVASPAAAFDFFDGRVEVHGFYEMQVRSLWEDFNARNDWDLAQWYHVLNLQVEADVAEDWGPFDLVKAYLRVEARYDCVWRRGCGIFPNVDVYGDRSGRLPQRLSDGRRSGLVGTQFSSEDGRIGDADTRGFNRLDDDVSRLGFENRDIPGASRKAADFPFIENFNTFFSVTGPDGVIGSIQKPGDDPGLFVFGNLLGRRCVYGHHDRRGPGNNVRVMPHDPGCRIVRSGFLRDRPNPFHPGDRNRVVLGAAPFEQQFGSGSLPFRPHPRYRFEGARAPRGEAQGIFVPSQAFADLERRDELTTSPVNFKVRELEWNRGDSQQHEGEFKEGYLDMEFFDSRLWLRLGRQNIVWGKTELFRGTDVFNPVDLALASLPSLEESRIAQWALRAVWAFYNLGPFEDVRLELVMNLNRFQPNDLGRCGEPFSPRPVCGRDFGLQAHGLTGAGLAGEIRPPDWWESARGLQFGGRLEFRWDRFALALSDYWGYSPSFYADQLFNYSRNVDPTTGRPRKAGAEGPCRTGREPACLTPSTALTQHHANQQMFAMVCASTVGVTELDRGACAQNIFNSQALADPTNPLSPIVSIAITNILSGQNTGGLPITQGAALLESLAGFITQTAPLDSPTLRQLDRFPWVQRYASATVGVTGFCIANFGALCPTPLVPLNEDVADGVGTIPFGFVPDGVSIWGVSALSPFLSVEQQALLGCGPFYRTNCDRDGMDFLNAEASVLFQSFPVFEGTFGTFWDTTNRRLAQPGTTRFRGGPVATRAGAGCQLPGSRGPGQPCYNVRQDGTIMGQIHPFTGQQFRSEMATLSWNFLMTAVGLSQPPEGQRPDVTHFDPNRPFRRGGCSFREPQWCSFVQGLIQLTGVTRPSILAGGNGEFGRRNFLWSGGAEVVLRYDKRNVLGFAVDFAEDVTKTNWGVELSWVKDVNFANVNRFRGFSPVDLYNLTVSIDRPTFVNFLNANRTLFINAQIFFQYIDKYERGLTNNGPWNVLGTLTVNTGYFQDRLLPGVTVVYDMNSNSGAFLPQVQYRFTENFSATVGVLFFWGREQLRDQFLHNPDPSNDTDVGRHAGRQGIENALTAVRERDEIFLRLRYTF